MAFTFGTKAETLEALGPLLRTAKVLDLIRFTALEWSSEPVRRTDEIAQRFVTQRVIVRSSAIGEDAVTESRAGKHLSVPNVVAADRDALSNAITAVLASYDDNPSNQVLVQPMLEAVAMSGVVMTRGLEDGGPYLTVNYDESGSTDGVTSGTTIGKTVHIHGTLGRQHLRSERLRLVVDLCQELCAICDQSALDVEFALNEHHELYLLQARPITTAHRWEPGLAAATNDRLPCVARVLEARRGARPGVVGDDCILGVMPDWNPAEMLGTFPGPLSVSLYRHLITRDVWRMSRAALGYRPLHGEELMVVIGGRPYIDVRNSLNSLLPERLDPAIGTLLVNAWQARLKEHPDLHDKVEFEVATTCSEADGGSAFSARYPGLLDTRKWAQFDSCLRDLTRRALSLESTGSLPQAERRIEALQQAQLARGKGLSADLAGLGLLTRASDLLGECREFGTLPFATLARHAFIAETLLRSLVRQGALDHARLLELKRGVRTVGSELSRALGETAAGLQSEEDFLASYGHLRPGTYDIRSARYAERLGIFRSQPGTMRQSREEAPFSFLAEEARAIDRLLDQAGLGTSAEGLLCYARRAIAGREWAKFVFSRNLSDALESLAAWGQENGLSREELSHISIEDLLRPLHEPGLTDQRQALLQRARMTFEQAKIARGLKLGFLIRDVADIYVVPVHRTTPTFVGCGHLRAPVVLLGTMDAHEVNLSGKLVCIEGADPGFDFVFSHGIAGLITKYGGANSHMAIRAHELRTPSAIGCGEQTFRRVVASPYAELDCDHRILRPAHAS